MADLYAPLLEHAKRDERGNIAVAHLQRHREDIWDALVVNRDLQPLYFWAAGEPPGGRAAVTADDDSYLMALVATPPGVDPGGITADVVDEWGSPTGRFAAIVTSEGLTMIGSGGDDSTNARREPAFGPKMLRSLLDQVAYKDDDGYRVTELEAVDGSSATILLDWDGRPLLFWTTMPGKESRELFSVLVSPRQEGLLAIAVDSALRPLYSDVPGSPNRK